MPPHRRTSLTPLTLLLVGWFACAAGAADDFSFYHENVMGTAMELRVRADDREDARRAEAKVLEEIDRLSRIFSGYDATSEFSRWQTTTGVPTRLSPELYELLDLSDKWQTQSQGAFDPRVEALTRLWSTSARQNRSPTAKSLDDVKALMSRPAWRLDSGSQTGERLSECPLSLNAIAKGYIVDRAACAAFDPKRGILGVLLNVGGDMRVCGETTRIVGIEPPANASESTEPFTYLEVRDRSVSTSGGYHRGLSINGRWYSHIFDPRTGMPVDRVASATVVAPRGADADALAKVVTVLPVEESLRLVATLDDVECLIVLKDGRTERSAGWNKLERARTFAFADSPKATTTVPADWWGNTNELLVNFEINQPDAKERRYRRPYVAIWVEDKDGNTIRNLILFVSLGGSGPERWLPDLKRWYRDEKNRSTMDKKNMVFAIAQATRPPGKYKVIWDGKDDQGKPVPSGEYTLFIETAREHGTYQSIRKNLTIGNELFTQELKGNVEIKSASIDYRRKEQPK